MLFENIDKSLEAKIVVEDDGRVAYAYLVVRGEIVADVWLYNCATCPELPEWTNPERMPFANPRGFVVDEDFTPVADEKDIDIEWKSPAIGNTIEQVIIRLRGRNHAKLVPGSKPGWCRLAAKNGPLARVWHGTF